MATCSRPPTLQVGVRVEGCGLGVEGWGLRVEG